MKHNIRLNGYSYRLRPVELSDAQFIIDVRLEDFQKSKFLHKISSDINLQIKWLEDYFLRENDYYFVIENLFTKLPEGLISIYNKKNNKAEWGRWVLKRSSLASIESVNLIYQIAFEKLGLDELYTTTLEENKSVVDFHKNINAKFRAIIKENVELEGLKYNSVEQYVDKQHYYSKMKTNLTNKCIKLFERNMRQFCGKFKFHHIGIATKNIEEEIKKYSTIYEIKDIFEDTNQGVKGAFITSENKPTLELLENLQGFHTLDYYLENSIKDYHRGYLVSDIEKTYKLLMEVLGAKIISDMKLSTYFKKRICFFILKNKSMIELMEV